jgi:hypothetical protein
VTTTTVNATFHNASLLEFHRDHQMYEWTNATAVAIGTQTTSRSGRLCLVAHASRAAPRDD